MSKEMLEAAWKGALDRELLKALDEPWVCTSELHGHSTIHDGPAVWVVEANCEHVSGFRCATYVSGLHEWITRWLAKGVDEAICECGVATKFQDLKILPLGKTS